MIVTACIWLLLSLCLLTHVRTHDLNSTESCVQLYEKGVEAYLENRFEDCITNFKKAVQTYGLYKKRVQYCRLKCRNEAEESDPLYHVNVDNLLFFERALKQTLCLLECQNNRPEILENYNINAEVEMIFEQQKPYEYLQLCYFQTKDFMKAASSAFTYLVFHPDDKVMQSNLKHYSTMEKVDMNEIVNYEAKDYVYLYVHGADAYERQEWKDTINLMEESLADYLQAEDECRIMCEGPYDHGWYPDLIPAISNHFTVCLKCKQNCWKRLGSLNGEFHNDLLPSHYNYLQYAYFKLGKLKAACEAVASYLLFYPNDDIMLSNKEYYSKLPKVQKDYFRPREEAMHYHQRNSYERKILKFIEKEFSSTSPPDPVKVKQEVKTKMSQLAF